MRPAQVLLPAPAHGHRARLDKLLQAQIVDALCRKDDVRAGLEDFANALERDVGLSPADGLELLWVVDGDVNTEVHPLLLQVHVKARNLCSLNALLHGLRRDGDVDGVAFDKD